MNICLLCGVWPGGKRGNATDTIKASAYFAASIDGYIAREDGTTDWLPAIESGEDYGYAAFMQAVDFLVMGRNTYDQVLTFDTWPYGDKPVVVLSSRAVPLPGYAGAVIEQMAGAPAEIIAELAERGAKHLYVDGGNTILRFAAAGALHELIITRIPVLLGRGISLCGYLPGDVRLQHKETRCYTNGLVQSRYEVLR